MRQEENYRDKVSTIGEGGKRVWLYPSAPKGKWFNKRKLVSVVLLTILFVTPFIKIDGNPFFLFNFLERKFILFGNVFWPQDFHLFVLVMITGMVFIVLFTVIYGRLWCGWACPQTLFMEIVFRQIEHWIEGTPSKRKKLDAQEWNTEKIQKKGLKHIIFIAISFLIANTLLAYVVGVDELKLLVTNSPKEELELFIAVVIFTGVFYSVFAFFREQACTLVCPYGRLQGVFLDNKSICVSYDHVRGESRGKLKKGQERTEGDCVDCKLCVNVCPTGIDIRDGIQLECVNCTACMDACDIVMGKVGFEQGLIRYASNDDIEKGEKFKFTPRIIAYSAVLALLIGFIAFLMQERAVLETTVLRAKGKLYTPIGEDTVSNMYYLQMVNKSFEDIHGEIKLIEPANGRVIPIGRKEIAIAPQGIHKQTFLLYLPKSSIEGLQTKVKLQIVQDGEVIEKVKTTFLGPAI